MTTPPTLYRHIQLPIRYFGLRPQHLTLPEPVTAPVIEAATHALLHHHTTDCITCAYLHATHNGFHPPLQRAATILGTMALTYLAYALITGDLMPIVELFTTGTVLATVWIHIILAAGATVTAIHRRHLPTEMTIRVRRAHLEQTRPGADHTHR